MVNNLGDRLAEFSAALKLGIIESRTWCGQWCDDVRFDCSSRIQFLGSSWIEEIENILNCGCFDELMVKEQFDEDFFLLMLVKESILRFNIIQGLITEKSQPIGSLFCVQDVIQS